MELITGAALLALAGTLCWAIVYAIVRVFDILERNMASNQIPAPHIEPVKPAMEADRWDFNAIPVKSDNIIVASKKAIPAPHVRSKKVSLTEGDVREMRSMFLSGDYTMAQLAKLFKCCTCAATRAVKGITWGHVKNPGPVPQAVIDRLVKERRQKNMLERRPSQNGRRIAA